MIFSLFPLILFALIFSLAIAPLAVRLIRRVGMIDHPASAPHKIHKEPMPLAGGTVLLLTIGIGLLISGTYHSDAVLAIYVSSLIIFVFGVWDDMQGLSAPVKLVGQLIAVFVLVQLGVQVNFTPYALFNMAVTFFWVVGVTNAYNLIDSMDGLVAGLAGLAASFFMLVTLDAGQMDLALFSAVLLGSCVGVYYYNSSPASFFLGDSGAQLLGFLLASLAIVYTPVDLPQASSWFVPILLLGMPIFDTTLVTLSRLRRGLPVYKANRDHTYHRLIALGMPTGRAVLSMHISAAIAGCSAFIALTLPPLPANLVFVGALLVSLVAIIWLERHYPARS